MKMPCETSSLQSEGKHRPRKPYHRPGLEKLGDLRTLTLGGSPGTGESGNMTRNPKLGFSPHKDLQNPDNPFEPKQPPTPGSVFPTKRPKNP
jgi:hypothetical protein